MASVAARYDELKELGAEVLSCSVDSEYTHKIWQEQELTKMVPGGVPYPMLSDKGGKLGRLYGVYNEKEGVNIRGRFLIDPDGIVQAMEVLTLPVGRNFGELLRQIKAFQHVRETGQPTPAGWVPGKISLKPSVELVGKVWEVWKASDE